MMTPEQAAWVRQHAWTKKMRHTYAETPGFYTSCACQYGLTSWCQHDKHGRCHRAKPLTSHETVICWRGDRPAYFLEEFTHKTEDATGWKRSRLAMVWLADRVCRWVCPCGCHTAPAAPEQLGLFVEVS